MDAEREIAALRAENAMLKARLVSCEGYRAKAARLQREVDMLRMGARASIAPPPAAEAAPRCPREDRADIVYEQRNRERGDAS